MPLQHPTSNIKATTTIKPSKVPFPTNTPGAMPSANGIIRQDTSKKELAAYYASTVYNMRPSTLIRAIKRNYLDSWPGLTASLISRHLPKSLASAKGHLDQEFKNLQSTSTAEIEELPHQEPNNVKTQHMVAALIQSTDLPSKSYSDQTGKFPVESSRGNNYIFVLYHYDTNSIHATAIPNRQAATITKAWKHNFDVLKAHGETPDLHILDNECSNDLRRAFTKNDIVFQLVPPHLHRRNAAERAIRTFKNHLIAGLCTCDPKFPVNEWDRLLPQAVITLNLVRSSRRNPSLSAHAAIFGSFNFQATPMAPPGTRVIIHLKPAQRASFGAHGLDGWYIGPALDHYRCYTCFVPSTNAERHPDTVEFFPVVNPIPSISTDSYLRQAADDILYILKHPQKTIPSLTYGNEISNAYIHLAQILKRATAPPPTTKDPTPVPRVIAPPRVVAPPRVIAPPRVHEYIKPSPTPTDMKKFPRPEISKILDNKHNNMQPPVPTRHNHLRNLKLITDTSNRKIPDVYSHRYTLRPRPYLRRSYNEQAIGKAQSIIAHQSPYKQHIASHVFHPTSGAKQSLDTLRSGQQGPQWTKGLSNELGRLAQGVGKARTVSDKIVGTDTIHFIPKTKVPVNAKVTYANFICDLRPLKKEKHRVRCTVGGDRLDYEEDPSSPAAGLLDIKIHLNSTISDAVRGARYATADIENYYLNNPMKIFRYMRIALKDIPPEIIIEYNLLSIAHNGYVFVEISKGMYGLKEAGIIAFKRLVANLAPHGYHPVRFTPGLWKHDTLPTTFTLAVDDFGIKYFQQDHLDHLFMALRTNYNITTDMTGRNYCGLTLDWQYPQGYVDISMPGYIHKSLQKFRHPLPKRPQHAPHQWVKPNYGQKVQYALPPSSLPILDKAGTRRIQSINGTFLYYARAVDPCILPACNEIGTQQSAPTEATNKAATMLMDYLSTYPSATIRYHASDMCLHIDSDAAYLVLPKARSRGAGHFYLSNTPPISAAKPDPTPNGPIHTECVTLRNVMTSAAEAETQTVYHNGKVAIPIRTTLLELGHPQPPTPIKTDNSTACGILNASMRKKRSKAFDMKIHFMIDRIQQKEFQLYWDRGKNNLGDYFTKHHPPSHHKIMRPKYLHVTKNSFSKVPS